MEGDEGGTKLERLLHSSVFAPSSGRSSENSSQWSRQWCSLSTKRPVARGERERWSRGRWRGGFCLSESPASAYTFATGHLPQTLFRLFSINRGKRICSQLISSFDFVYEHINREAPEEITSSFFKFTETIGVLATKPSTIWKITAIGLS